MASSQLADGMLPLSESNGLLSLSGFSGLIASGAFVNCQICGNDNHVSTFTVCNTLELRHNIYEKLSFGHMINTIYNIIGARICYTMKSVTGCI